MCSIERFAAMVQRRPGARDAVLCPDEALLPVASQAARFAAKEALAKALGAPPGLGWHDAEVITDELGRPSLVLRGTVLDRARELGVTRTHLSLSHDAGVAVAQVVCEA